jgi:hypothetical protein
MKQAERDRSGLRLIRWTSSLILAQMALMLSFSAHAQTPQNLPQPGGPGNGAPLPPADRTTKHHKYRNRNNSINA